MDGEEDFPIASVSDEQVLQTIQSVNTEVKSLISRSAGSQAVLACINGLDIKATSEAAKKLAAETFTMALVSLPVSSLDNFLNELTQAQRDVIIKYTYAGMAYAEKKHCEVLLVINGKIVSKDGIGSVSRAIFTR